MNNSIKNSFKQIKDTFGSMLTSIRGKADSNTNKHLEHSNIN